MHCPRCGHTNRLGAAFCSACGASLAYLQGHMRLQPAQTIKGGAYEIVRPLTQGGMGAIYLVKDLEAFDRLRVLKEMLDYVDPADYPDRGAYEQAVRRAHERFEDEARILASLHHPGIPEIIAYFSELGRNYIVMEYVEGKDLNEGLTHVDEQGQLVPGQPYPVRDVVRWGIQACRILEYLAQRTPTPVIHHDIKPANLVLDKRSGAIRLVDFGTAQARLLAQADTQMGLKKPSIFGTMGYAPPEQYQGKSVPRSDVYALAATMYHLLTDDDPQQHPMSFPWPTALERRLVRALSQAVEPDLRRRSTAAQFREALERWLAVPKPKKQASRKGDYRVVLAYVPGPVMEQTILALQQELSMTEPEATITAYSAPSAVLSTTSYATAEQVASQLQGAGAGARLVEVDESYSRSLGPGTLRQHLVSRGQVRRLVSKELSRSRTCHCFACGHDWTSPRHRRRRPPKACPKCGSKRWNVRRVFKCRVCGHEFAHGDHDTPAQQLFPACPACGTLDWLSRQSPVLKVLGRKVDLGTVRLGQPKSVVLSIRNRGRGSLRGVVRCREPWLQAERSFSGQGEIAIPIDTGLLKGERHYQARIEVLSNGGTHQVRVELLAQTPERVTVSPSTLDFGRVDARPAPQILRVRNDGGGVLRGTLATDAPWLKLSSREIRGNAVELSVSLLPAEMPPGQTVNTTIRLTTNGGQVTVPVQAQALLPKLALEPQSLDFGTVPPREVRRLAVRVSNRGTGHLQGRLTSWPDWLRPGQTRWSGNSRELAMAVDGRRLGEGVPRTGVVHFSSNGGNAELKVQAAALGPTLLVEPSALYLGEMAAGARARCRLRLSNAGSGRLNGSARSTAPWLSLEQSRFAGKRVRLDAWVRTRGLAPGAYTGTIDIESNGGQTSAVVQMQITERTDWRQRLGDWLSR